MTVHPYDGVWLCTLRGQSDADRLLLRRLAKALAGDPAGRLSVALDLLERYDATPPAVGGFVVPDSDTDDYLPLHDTGDPGA